MTVSELIAYLQKQPPENRIVVSGYEDGYDDISLIKTISVLPIEGSRWWEGKWREDNSGSPAILIWSRNRG